MKWLSIKEHTPPGDGYYIVRLASDEENSGDFMYAGDWFVDGKWLPLDPFFDPIYEEENFVRTHFIIPDQV